MNRPAAERLFAILRREESFDGYPYPGPVTGLPHIGHGILLPLRQIELAAIYAIRHGWTRLERALALEPPEAAMPLNPLGRKPTNRIWKLLLPLSDAESDWVMRFRMDAAWHHLLSRHPWIAADRRLPDDVQLALAQMAYQLGVADLLEFRDTLGALKEGRYAAAYIHALDSKWFALDTPDRALLVAASYRRLAVNTGQVPPNATPRPRDIPRKLSARATAALNRQAAVIERDVGDPVPWPMAA